MHLASRVDLLFEQPLVWLATSTRNKAILHLKLAHVLKTISILRKLQADVSLGGVRLSSCNWHVSLAMADTEYYAPRIFAEGFITRGSNRAD
jgi:hypothetical protein